MKVLVTRIDWDTDGDMKAFRALPQEVEIDLSEVDDSSASGLADWLSDRFGWCVNSLEVTDNNAPLSSGSDESRAAGPTRQT